MAAWDLLAKSVALSLTRLLGGEEKPIPAYHSLGMAGPDGAAREAAELNVQKEMSADRRYLKSSFLIYRCAAP